MILVLILTNPNWIDIIFLICNLVAFFSKDLYDIDILYLALIVASSFLLKSLIQDLP